MNYFGTVWKDLIHAYFPEFIEFFFPGVASQLDLKGDLRFLDQEMENLIPNNGDSYCYADILLQAPKKKAPKDSSNRNNCELIHIRIQGGGEPGFTEKLFLSTYHIYERFRSLPISLVVCTDDDPNFYPGAFEILDAQRYLRLEYTVAKLLYFRARVEDPDCYHNPFAFVTHIQLEVHGLKRRNEEDRDLQLKRDLLSELFSYPCAIHYKSSLARFLDWTLPISDSREKQMQEVLSRKILRWYLSLRIKK